MNSRKLALYSTGLMLMVLVLAACGPVADPEKGRWEGEHVSFTVTESGEIADFSWTLRADEGPFLECPISIPEELLPITGGVTKLATDYTPKDLKFTFNMKVVFNTTTSALLSYEYNFCPSNMNVSINPDGEFEVSKGNATAKWVEP